MSDVRVGDEQLGNVWLDAAKGAVTLEKRQENLFATFCHYATDNSLDDDAFNQRTKRMEENMQREAIKGDKPNVALQKAIRSTSSSARSVVANALRAGLPVVRNGKAVGKTRLENEVKARTAGAPLEAVMAASTDALKSMANPAPANNKGKDATPSTGNAAKDKANRDAEVIDNLETNLKRFVQEASDEIVNDLAFILATLDPRLTLALKTHVDVATKKAA